jgi:general secretion pathway protein H
MASTEKKGEMGKARTLSAGNRKGFSLLELTIVLVIMSLSVALVTPYLARFSTNLEVKTSAQRISGILRYCRNEAVQKGKAQQILFDTAAREIRIQEVVNPNEEGKEAEKKGERTPGKKYMLPEGIQIHDLKIPPTEFSSELPAIEFYPNGGSNGGSFLLERENQKGYRIKVNFLTGMVEIKAG